MTPVKDRKTVKKLDPIDVGMLKNVKGRKVYKHDKLNEIGRSLFITTGRGDETLDSLLMMFTVEDNPGMFTFEPQNVELSFDYL